MTKITILTFERFYDQYHQVTGERRIDKRLCEKLWNSIISPAHLKAIMDGIKEHKLKRVPAYDYLKIMLLSFKYKPN